MRKSATRLVLLATAVLAAACGQNSGDTGAAAEFDRVWAAAVNIDSVGVSNIAEGDTIVSESGLTMYAGGGLPGGSAAAAASGILGRRWGL